MRSPNWQPEELKLALCLYMSKDLEWLAKMTDMTKEIIQLSEILNKLDFYVGERPDNFRSPGSIRMKLTNFKALNIRYGKTALSNIGNLDRDIWNEYFDKFNLLQEECKKIIKKHYQGYLSDEIKKMFECNVADQISEDSFLLEWNSFVQITNEQAKRLRKCAVKLEDIEHSQKIMSTCYEITKAITDYEYIQNEKCSKNNIYEEHAGINQVPVINNEIKIGKYVQSTIEELINKKLLTAIDIGSFLDSNWTKEVFHLGHPFFLKIDMNVDVKKQITDTNGYIRYWTKIYSINGEKYCICKEWYESNRKYFDIWYKNILSINKLKLSEKSLLSLLEYLKEKDEQNLCITKEEIFRQLNENVEKDNILNQLTEMGLLVEFQGSRRDFVIDDYDLLFSMLNNLENYIA
jgi:hypothetical protein